MDLQRRLDEALEAGRRRTAQDAESKRRDFEAETLKTRLAAKEVELAEARAKAEEGEKREAELKRTISDYEIAKGDVSKQLAEVSLRRRRCTRLYVNWFESV